MLSQPEVEIHLNNWGRCQRQGDVYLGYDKTNPLWWLGHEKGSYKFGEKYSNIDETEAEKIQQALDAMKNRYPLFTKIITSHYYHRKRGKDALSFCSVSKNKYYSSRKRALSWLQIHLPNFLYEY